ncbi:MAG: copper transporter [Solirubrobacterales bacterium]
MGYSARYHAFSIIAIFAALAIGIVIGAGFGQDVISGTAANLEESLQSDLEESRVREDELAAVLEREQDFGLRVYPPLVDGRLEGDRIGVIALGELPESLAREIEATVEPTGGQLSKVAVVRDPPDLAEIADLLGAQLENLPDAATEERLGRTLGAQLVEGGRLIDRGRDQLLSRFSGSPEPIDDVILTTAPVEGLTEAEQASLDRFEKGLLEGVHDTGKPSVAVELSTTSPSTVPIFDAEDIPTVDSLDLTSGKLSAVFALLGNEGNFGIKETADRELPDLVPAAPDRESGGGGGGGR